VTLLKLALVPLVVWLASMAGRRWGHAASGWIAGLPLIAGPIMVFLVLDHGPEFGAHISTALLNASAGPVGHCLAFAWASRRFGWLGSLLCGIAAFVIIAFTTSAFPMPAWAAFALVIAAIFAALRWMPRVTKLTGPAAIPRIELIVRVAAAGLIAAMVTFGATELGPRLSGVLLTFPISGTVMPAFTRALYGSDATIRLLAGFIKGLTAFGVFFVVLAYCLVPCGPLVAFTLAIVIGLAASEFVRRLIPT
jgi:hypothetical protein